MSGYWMSMLSFTGTQTLTGPTTSQSPLGQYISHVCGRSGRQVADAGALGPATANGMARVDATRKARRIRFMGGTLATPAASVPATSVPAVPLSGPDEPKLFTR